MFNNVIVLVLFLLSSVSIGGFILVEKEVSGIEYSCNENVVVCNGDETDDQIAGTENNDIIFGWTGNDFLRGMAGDDVILGGEGADTIIGDISNDVLNDTIHGKDVSIGGPGDDILMGYNGNDDIYGGQGDDRLRDFGPSYSDEINNFFGEEGNDLLVASRSTDIFNCGEGIDVVVKFNITQGDKADESNCEMLIQ
jgi:Ca2+-binding RTX toxin-like protein